MITEVNALFQFYFNRVQGNRCKLTLVLVVNYIFLVEGVKTFHNFVNVHVFCK